MATYNKTCLVCQNDFVSKKAWGKFCCSRCKTTFAKENYSSRRKLYEKHYYAKNKDRLLEKSKKFFEQNKNYHKEWYIKNKDKHLPRTRARHRQIYAEWLSEFVPKTVREEARALGYKSGFEKTLALSLEKRNAKFKYEPVKLNYVQEHVYIPDFVLDNGIIIEAKGLFDQQTRSKMLAVKRQHPEKDIRFVFQAGDKKLSKNSKVSYLQWAEKNGFPAVNKEIPDEWLK